MKPLPSTSRTSPSNWTRTKIALTGLLLLVLTACGGPAYKPLPDATLYSDIEAIPGVTKQKINSHDSMSQGTGYGGQILIDTTADPVDVLDGTLAILWQGMPDASYIGVRVIQKDGEVTRSSDVGLTSPDDFEARYGPQPGTGEPPADKPPLKLKQ